MLPVVAPELVPLADTPQDPEWHPEGDVWTHTLLAVDQAAGAPRGPRPPARARGDAGDPVPRPRQARHHEVRGRAAPLARPRGGGRAADRVAARALERAHAATATTCAAQVLALVAQPPQAGPALRRPRARVATAPSAAWRASASPTCSIAWRAPTAWAGGRATSRRWRWSGSWSASSALDVARAAAGAAAAGPRRAGARARPGPGSAGSCRAVYELQLDGAVTTLDEARAEAAALPRAPRVGGRRAVTFSGLGRSLRYEGVRSSPPMEVCP